MNINILIVSFVIAMGVLCGANDTKKMRGLYIIVCSAVLIFVAAMRSPKLTALNYGIDTLSYKSFFESSFDMNWEDFGTLVYERYVEGKGESDIGFLGLIHLVSLFTHNFAAYSFIADLLFFIPFGTLLYRCCERTIQIVFAFVYYIALFQVFLLGGGRQMFAIGFDLMALLSMIDGKKLRVVVFSLIAISIHFSALLFIVPLLMIWFGVKPRILKSLHIFSLFFFPVVLAFPNQFITLMGNAVGSERYASYGKGSVAGGANNFIFLIFLLSLFCYITIRKKDLLCNNTLRVFYVMAPLMTLFAPLIHSNGSMIRISMYFHLFLFLLVSYGIDCFFSKSSRRFVYCVFIGGLSFMTLLNSGANYFFFWQG